MQSEKNVILLTMSTLPTKPGINTYQYKTLENKVFYFKGISQLEAHSKLIIKLLDEKSVKVDRIVMLVTPETKKGRVNYADKSAIDIYKDGIAKYLKNEERQILNEISDPFPDTKETQIENVIYGKEIEFSQIDLNSNIFFWDAAEKITAVDETGELTINLWMDMQGGNRNMVAQMNAITQLLKDKNVKIVARFANDFTPGAPKICSVSEVSENYKAYDLLTAMQVFKNYGRGDELVEFVESSVKKSGLESDERDIKLVKAIKDASDAIQTCNIDGFDIAIKEIKDLSPLYEKKNEYKTQLDIVFEGIYEDYREIIESKYPYVGQIRWCIKKKYIQQALTILESKMPTEYVTSGLKYYCRRGEEQENKQKYEGIYNAIDSKDRYKMKDINHFFIKDLGNISNRINTINTYYGYNRVETDNSIRKYKDLSKKRNTVNHTEESSEPNGFFSYMHSRHPNDNNFKTNSVVTQSLIEEMEEYLDNFEKLANNVSEEVRNSVVDLR